MHIPAGGNKLIKIGKNKLDQNITLIEGRIFRFGSYLIRQFQLLIRSKSKDTEKHWHKGCWALSAKNLQY